MRGEIEHLDGLVNNKIEAAEKQVKLKDSHTYEYEYYHLYFNPINPEVFLKQFIPIF